MYLRTTTPARRDGSEVRYLSARPQRVGPGHEALERARPVPPGARGPARPGRHPAAHPLAVAGPGARRGARARVARAAPRRVPPVRRRLAARRLWDRLGLPAILARALRGRRRDPAVERVLFALVANRALEPMSKLSCAAWVTREGGHPGPRRARRGPLLPGHGLAARGGGRGRGAGLLVGRHAARPRGRPAVLRHHQHLLRDRRGGPAIGGRGQGLPDVRPLQGPPA